MRVRSETRSRVRSQPRFEPRIKLWMEKDGRLVLSDYRVDLLEQISQTGSLAEAAERMGLSYRRAWGKVREIEENLGRSLVHSEAGGPGGGGSRLTEDGERLVSLYRRFRQAVERDLGNEFREVFHD
jgi:molybdate transport system regulatory protein